MYANYFFFEQRSLRKGHAAMLEGLTTKIWPAGGL